MINKKVLHSVISHSVSVCVCVCARAREKEREKARVRDLACRDCGQRRPQREAKRQRRRTTKPTKECRWAASLPRISDSSPKVNNTNDADCRGEEIPLEFPLAVFDFPFCSLGGCILNGLRGNFIFQGVTRP